MFGDASPFVHVSILRRGALPMACWSNWKGVTALLGPSETYSERQRALRQLLNSARTGPAAGVRAGVDYGLSLAT